MDISNGFIQTRIEYEKDIAIINIRGVLVYILLDISPDVYGPYVITYLKGVKQLIVQCQNIIYCAMMASLLYYKKFRNSLEDEGYEFNLHDPCVANVIIKGIQITVFFHVDDCKLSHKIPKVVGKMITWLKQ